MTRLIGLAVHPRRDVRRPVAELQDWAESHDARIVQVEVEGQQQQVAEFGSLGECELVVAVGGDGTALAAIRAAAPRERPVLGVACGSLGALTAVPAEGLAEALERFAAGSWEPRQLPALELTRPQQAPRLAYNDVAVVRAGEGQVHVGLNAGGARYARLAGDGCVISTPVGSAAYALAAGGPLLAPELDAILFTPLPSHGGSVPPLVVGETTELELELLGGPGGARLEVDGKIVGPLESGLRLKLRPGAATVVTLPGQDAYLTGLRRRGVILDSPRLVAKDRRAARA